MTKIFFDSVSADLSFHADRNRFGGYLKINDIENSTIENANIIVIPNTSDLSKWARYKKKNKKIIFDIPDAYLVEKSTFRKTFRSIAKYIFGEYKYFNFSNISLIKKVCLISDVVICCSLEQKILLSRYCKNVKIIYDFHNERILNNKKRFLDININSLNKNKINLLWEGLPINLIHFKRLDNLLYELSKKFDFTLNIITQLDSNLLKINSNKSNQIKYFTKFVNYKIYNWSLKSFSYIVSQSDIAIIPLDHKDTMSYYKGANKLLLMWKMGIPVIASAAPDYVRFMKNIEVDLYCKNINEWEINLTKLLNDCELRKNLGIKLNKYADDFYSDKNISTKWGNLISKL